MVLEKPVGFFNIIIMWGLRTFISTFFVLFNTYFADIFLFFPLFFYFPSKTSCFIQSKNECKNERKRNYGGGMKEMAWDHF